MLAAAVGTAPGTARTKKKCPGIVQVIKMGVISGLESQNGRPSDPRASIVVPADGQPWRCPAGKPWHEFVSCKCHVGTRMLSYVQTPVAKTSEWLCCLVGSIVGWTWTVREDDRRASQVVVRDRKVVRECALCIGMSAAAMAVAAMVDTRTDSSRTDRSHHLHGCLSA